MYDAILQIAKTYKGAIDNLCVDKFYKTSTGILVFSPNAAIQHPCYLTIEEQMNPYFKNKYL